MLETVHKVTAGKAENNQPAITWFFFMKNVTLVFQVSEGPLTAAEVENDGCSAELVSNKYSYK